MKNNKKVLQEEYKLRFSGLEAYRNRVWKVLCDNFFQQYIGDGKTILDLGSGYGEFINNIRAAKKYAMDLNPDSKKMLSEDIEFFNTDCSESWPIATEQLDVVFSSNFLEHLLCKDSVEETIGHAYSALKSGGTIVLLGPNIRYLPGAYWDFWDHHVAISDHSITELLKLKGFTVVKQVPRFLPYSMSSGKESPLIFVKLFIKMPIFWPLIGKQFFVVATKN